VGKHGRNVDPESRATAYHEAGHVAVGFHFGLPIGAVSIVPTEHSAGHFDWMDAPMDPEKQACCLLAGVFAESRVTDEYEDYDITAMGGVEDFATVHGLARGMADEEEAEELMKQWRTQTIEVLNEVWPGVIALADELLTRKCLTGEQAQRVLAWAEAG
jgi:hypothetical protein